VTYSAALSFPSTLAISGAHHRILIKEWEIYATDQDAGVDVGIGAVKVGGAPTAYTQRIVYADAILIPS